MWHRLRPHVHEFSCYIGSGTAALILDFGSYFLLLSAGTWYVTANVVGNILGFFGAFFFHKYLVFCKTGKIMNHFSRYCLLSFGNFIVQSVFLIAFIEYLHMGTGSAKVISLIASTLANFFLYKFFVYV